MLCIVTNLTAALKRLANKIGEYRRRAHNNALCFKTRAETFGVDFLASETPEQIPESVGWLCDAAVVEYR